MLGVTGLRLADADRILSRAGIDRIREIIEHIAKLIDRRIDLPKPARALGKHELSVGTDLRLGVKLKKELVLREGARHVALGFGDDAAGGRRTETGVGAVEAVVCRPSRVAPTDSV